MKVFKVIVETDKEVYRDFAYAKNKKELVNIYGGNGDIIKMEDVTDQHKIDTDLVMGTLINNGFGKAEAQLIKYILDESKENVIETL